MSLPTDLLLEIQLYLPVKSLLRFKCICKSWCSRFQSPNFIKDHHLKQLALDGNNFSNSKLMIERLGIEDRRDDRLLCFTSFNTDSDDITLKENIYMPFAQDYFLNREVLGPVNGVFCVTEDNLSALWNPATREIKVLPVSTLERPTRFPPLDKHEIYDGFGFGFDSKSSDYKVVAFVGYSYFESPQTEVYNLSSDSWKIIPSSHGYNLNYFRQYHAYVNGVFHWFATDSIPNANPIRYIQQIVSFDMVDEDFFTTPLPDIGATWWKNGWFLAAIDDCPAAIVCRCEDKEGPKRYDVWLLKEPGSKESWFKKHTIGPISGIHKPLGFWKKGRVFVDGKAFRFMMYDPDSENLVDLHVRIPFRPVSLVIYVESLVSINGVEMATHLKVEKIE